MKLKVVSVMVLFVFLGCFQIAWARVEWNSGIGDAIFVPDVQNTSEITPPPPNHPPQDGTKPVDKPEKRDKVDDALRENGINPDDLSDNATVEEVTDENGSDAQNVRNHIQDRITHWNDKIPAMKDDRIQNNIPEIRKGDVIVRDPENGALYILRPDNSDNPTRYNLIYSETTRPYDSNPDTEGYEGKVTNITWYDEYEEDSNGSRRRTEHAIQEVDEDGDGEVDRVSIQPQNIQEYGEHKDMKTGRTVTGWYDKEDHDISYWDKEGNPVAPLYSPFADGKPIYVDIVYDPHKGVRDYTFKDASGDSGEVLATRHKELVSRQDMYGHQVTLIDETRLNISALKKGYQVDDARFSPEFKNYVSAQLRQIQNNPDWFSDVQEIVWHREYGVKGRDSSGNPVGGLLFSSVGYESQKLGLRQAGAIWTGEEYLGYQIDRSRKEGDRYVVEMGWVGTWSRSGTLTSRRRILQGRLVDDQGAYKLDLQNLRLQRQDSQGGSPSGGRTGGNVNTRQDAITDYQRLRDMPLEKRLEELVNRGVLDPAVAEAIKGLSDEDARKTYLARSLYLKNLGLDGEQSVHLLSLIGDKEKAINYLCEVLGITPEEAESIYNTLIAIQGQDMLKWYLELLNYSEEEIQKYLELTDPEEKEKYLREVLGINDEELIQQILALNLDEAYQFLTNRSIDIDIEEFLSLESDDQREEFLVNYLVNEKGMSEEDARAKAEEIMNLVNNGGALEKEFLLSIGLSPEQVETYDNLTADHARIDYLTTVAHLPLYTAQLIVGKMVDENGNLVDLPQDYLNPILDTLEDVIEQALQEGIIGNQGLEDLRARLINEVYQAIYRGEIIPDNSRDKIREILEGLLNGNEGNPNFADRIPEPEI